MTKKEMFAVAIDCLFAAQREAVCLADEYKYRNDETAVQVREHVRQLAMTLDYFQTLHDKM